MKFTCAHCGKVADKRAGEVNRARAQGLRLFCDRRCAGLGRRKPRKPTAERKLEKRLYDIAYRAKNRETLKAKKHARHKRTYDPVKAAKVRKARLPYHVQYCRRPEYKRWKSGYDRRHRAKKFYGAFAEVAMLTCDLNREIKGRMTNHEIKWQNRTSNKTQFRRRADKAKERTRPRFRDRRRDHPAAVG